MTRLALVLILCCLFGPARAQTAQVISGEHPDFSRLVIPLGTAPGWQLGRVADGYELRVRDGTTTFDTSDVYRLIPPTRIAALGTPAPGVLRLAVGCTCHADAFPLRGNRIVIDIKDGPAEAGSAFEARLDAGRSPPSDTAAAETVPPAGLAGGSAAAADSHPAAAPFPLPDAAAMMPPPVPAANLRFDAASNQRTREFEAMVLEQLARAGAQGLIVPGEPHISPPGPKPADDPAPGPEHADGGAPAAAHDAGHPAPDPQPAHPPETAPSGDHVRIETSVDRDRAGADDANAAPAEDGQPCPSSPRVDPSAWGFLAGGTPDIASYRDGLSGEFDRIDPARAFKLARYYVFLGFGAEALQQLTSVPASFRDRDLVAAMAELVDRDAPAEGPAAFDGLQSCSTAAALWALLSGPGLRPGQAVDENAVLQAFGSLPDHLKRHLGPRLVDIFRGADRTEPAEIIRNRMNLAGPGGDIGVAVANAHLDQDSGDHSGAEKVLDTALAEADPESPEALLALAETKIAAGQSVEADLVSALEALAFDQRGRPLGRRIDRAIAESYLSRRAYRTARDLAIGTVGEFDGAAAADLIRRIYTAAAAEAETPEFLRLAIPEPQGLERTPREDAARLAIAARLETLGFAGDALAVLGQLAQSADDGRRIAAAADLQLGRPQAAVAALAALDPATSAPLMARAQEMLGRYDRARAAYEQAGQPEDAARMALMLQDWPDVAERGPPPLSGVAQLLSAPAAPPATAVPATAEAEALIDVSQRERTSIDSMLLAY